MGAARRVYVHVVLLVSAAAVTAGAFGFLEALLRVAEAATRGSIVSWGAIGREELSRSISLVAVGLPVWLVHDRFARRWHAAPGPRGDEDRGSAVRAGYQVLVGLVALVAALAALGALGGTLLAALLVGATDRSWASPLAAALVAIPVGVAAVRTRERELRTSPVRGPAAALGRGYRHVAAAVALGVALGSAAGVVRLLVVVAAGAPGLGAGDWWRGPLADEAAPIAVGLVAWALHLRLADAAIRDRAMIGEDERTSGARGAYFALVGLATTAWAVAGAAEALGGAARLAVGLDGRGSGGLAELVVAPALSILPVVAAGAWHLRLGRREAAEIGGPGPTRARRRDLVMRSLAGLGASAVGAGRLLEQAFRTLGDGTTGELLATGPALGPVTDATALLACGAVAWLAGWAPLLADRAEDPAGERVAALNRRHLFLVVGAGLVAAVPSASFSLYRVLDTLLGGSTGEPLLASLASPLAVAVVAVAVVGYHGRILARDVRAAAESAPAAEGGAARPARTGPVTVELVLRVPPGTDAGTLVDALRERLPAGASLERG